MKKQWFWLLTALIFLVAIFTRFYRLGEVPPALYWDEIAMLVDARSVAQTGQDMHSNRWLQALYPSYGDYKLPVYIWLASFSVKIFGVSEWALRLPSVLAGIGTIAVGMLLAWELFEKRKNRQLLSLSTGIVLMMSPWAMMFSRTAFEGHVGQFFVGLSAYVLLLSRKRPWLQWLAVILGVFATYAYFSVRFVWPAVFIAFFLFFKEQKKKTPRPLTGVIAGKTEKLLKFQKFAPLILGLGLYAALLYPMTQSPHYADSNQFRLSTTSVLNMKDWPVEANILREQSGNTLASRVVYHRHVLLIKELAKNYSDNLSLSFLFLQGDPNLRHSTSQHGLFLWVFLPSVFIGIYQVARKKPKALFFLAAWWLFALLPASVPEGTPHALRSLNALLPLALFIGYGTAELFMFFWSQKSKILRYISTFAVSTLVLAVFIEFCQYYFLIYPKTSSPEWQDGYKQLAEFTWEKYETDELDVIWVEPFDGRFHLWLMGYGMPVEMYQQLEYKNFAPAVIGDMDKRQIRFRWFDWGKLPTLTQKVLVVGEKSFIDGKLQEVPYPPDWYETIHTSTGEPEFAVIKFVRRE